VTTGLLSWTVATTTSAMRRAACASRTANAVVSEVAAQDRTSAAVHQDGAPRTAFVCLSARVLATRTPIASRRRSACANWAMMRSTITASRSVRMDAGQVNAWHRTPAGASLATP
jgi:hypothetical protein